MRQDDDIQEAKELLKVLQSIRQDGITKTFFQQLNSRAINNKLRDIPNHVLILLARYSLFRVMR